LIASPFIFPVAGNGVTTWLVLLGLFDLIVPLLTQTEPPMQARSSDGAQAHEGVGVYDAGHR
jgi:hypothetical protein